MTFTLKERAAFLARVALALALALSLLPAAAFASGAAQGADGEEPLANVAQSEAGAGDVLQAAEGLPASFAEGEELEAESEAAGGASTMSAEAQKAYEETGEYLAGMADDLGVANVGGEWAVIGLARGSQELDEGWADPYLSEAAAYVQANINELGQLHKNKSSDNSRMIIALTSLGVDPANFAGHDLLVGLTDMNYLKRQGVNGPIWALIAFDSGNYEIPAAFAGAKQVTRDLLVDYILEQQLADGGWALSGATMDPDVTGMALQALAPYRDSKPEVAVAVDKALTCLSAAQADDGGFSSWGDATSESSSQVIVALASLGIDPDTDSRFVKSANSVLEALLSYAAPGGGFSHVRGGAVDGMATEQAYYALAAVERLKAGLASLYDMSDVGKGEGAVPPAGSEDGEGPFNSSDEGEGPTLVPGDGGNEAAAKPAASGATVSIGEVSTEAAKEAEAKAAEDADDRVAYERSLSESGSAADEAAFAGEGEAFPWMWVAVGAAALAVLAGLGVARALSARKAGE